MARDYFSQYTGIRVAPLPQSYMEAATAPGRSIGEGIKALGEGVGKAIEQYQFNKQQAAIADAEIEAYLAPYMQDQGPTPTGLPRGVQEAAGLIGEKNVQKLVDGKATLSDKLAIANILRTKSAMRAQAAQAELAELQVGEVRRGVRQRQIAEDALRSFIEPGGRMTADRYSIPVGPEVVGDEMRAYYESGGIDPGFSEDDVARYIAWQKQQATPAPTAAAPQEFGFMERFLASQQEAAADASRAPGAPIDWPTVNVPQTLEATSAPPPAPSAPVVPDAVPRMDVPTFSKQMEGVKVEQMSPQEKDQAFFSYLRSQGVTDPDVLQQMNTLRNFGKVEVRDIGGQQITFVHGQPTNLGGVTPEVKMKLRTMTVDLPADGGMPAVQGVAQSTEEAVNFRNTYRDTRKIVQAIDQLREIIDTEGVTGALKPSVRAKVSTLIGGVVGASRLPFLGPGVMTDNEREWLMKLIGNPNNLSGHMLGTVRQRLDTFRDNALANMTGEAAAQGLIVDGGSAAPASASPGAVRSYVDDPRLR